jgi:uncharacterized membrane protein HdeD (DUF308 family)
MAPINQTAVKRLNWLGISLVLFGVAAIITPAIVGSAVVFVIGFILLAAGVLSIIRATKVADGLEKALGLTGGIITALAGISVVAHPLFGLAFLTLLLVVYFVVEGIWKIMVSFRYRPARGWIWLLLSGVASLVLGILIWDQWPVSGMWAVGVLVGINLLSTGLAFVALAATIKK